MIDLNVELVVVEPAGRNIEIVERLISDVRCRIQLEHCLTGRVDQSDRDLVALRPGGLAAVGVRHDGISRAVALERCTRVWVCEQRRCSTHRIQREIPISVSEPDHGWCRYQSRFDDALALTSALVIRKEERLI